MYLDLNGNGVWDGCLGRRFVWGPLGSKVTFRRRDWTGQNSAWSASSMRVRASELGPPWHMVSGTAVRWTFVSAPLGGLVTSQWSVTGRLLPAQTNWFLPSSQRLWQGPERQRRVDGCLVDGCLGPLVSQGLPWPGTGPDGDDRVGVFDPHTGLWDLDSTVTVSGWVPSGMLLGAVWSLRGSAGGRGLDRHGDDRDGVFIPHRTLGPRSQGTVSGMGAKWMAAWGRLGRLGDIPVVGRGKRNGDA